MRKDLLVLRVLLVSVLFAEESVGGDSSKNRDRQRRKTLGIANVPFASEESQESDAGSSNSSPVPGSGSLPVDVTPVTNTTEHTDVHHTNQSAEDTGPQYNTLSVVVQIGTFFLGTSLLTTAGFGLAVRFGIVTFAGEESEEGDKGGGDKLTVGTEMGLVVELIGKCAEDTDIH